MASNQYKLSYTASEIDAKLGEIDNLAKKSEIPTIPTALKNPSALTFTGAVTGSYDGSVAQTVNIPTVPTSLKNPSALTVNGQSYDGSVVKDFTNTINSMIDVKVGTKADVSHTHDDRYYTEDEIDAKLTGKADASHTHTKTQITNFPSAMPNPNAITINGISYDGSSAVNVDIDNTVDEETVNSLIDAKMCSVKHYGAIGDGATDDTAAFQAALAAERVVYVPSGTYVLSDTLLIEENCCLELSQDTVLQFTQTDKNCISMLRLANLNGNHATIFVPYTFSANVINCDGGDDYARLDADNLANSNAIAVPPFTKWDPQWKMSRYVTDVNICKPNNNGNFYSNEGDCYGTAVYLHCDEADWPCNYMWGVSMSGVRIAGGFNYGIRIYNIGDTADSWNHDMRIEAVIDACKVGISVENCLCARLAVTIQPRTSASGTCYAEHGIKLVDAKYTDLSSSRVWDWNDTNTLWTNNNEYQHLALYGECMGLILDDFLYYAQSSNDIRDLIYTDTSSNLEKMTILQEPITRWFKIKDGEPYFENGYGEKKLVSQEEMDNRISAHFNTEIVKNFTDVLPSATDTDGTIFNDIGYIEQGYYVAASGTLVASPYNGCTGFIPIKPGDVMYVDGVVIPDGGDGYSLLVTYDSSLTKSQSLVSNNASFDTGGSWHFGVEKLDNGFKVTVNSVADNANAAYIRFGFKTEWLTGTPMVAINEEIKYIVEGFLSDGVKVNGNSVILTSPSGYAFRLVVNDDGTLSTSEVTV